MKNFTSFLLVLGILAGCGGDGPKQDLLKDIAQLEAEIGTAQQPEPEKMEALMVKLEKFAQDHPGDSLSADYLSRAAEMARITGQFERALKIYDQILVEYFSHPEAAKALFMKGFTLDNDLKKMEEAKAVYEAFLQKYPEDGFADDAQFLLKNLGKTEEEIIRSFETEQNEE